MLAQFEYPLPELLADIDEITAETDSVYEGSFIIRNTGGGRLSGRITAHNTCAVFTPATFEGSSSKRINYRVSASGYNTGDVIHTGAVITSNGGEKFIPINLTVTAAAIHTEEGMYITNLRSFMEYARQYPNRAANLLVSPNFRQLLINNHFEFMDAYNHILSDTNRLRAMECLLRLTGLKKGAKVNVLQKYIEVKLYPFQKEKFFGRIPIRKEGWGYIEDKILIKGGSGWLKPLNTVSQAVEESGILNFSVDPALFKGRFASDMLILADNPGAEAVITVIRQPYIWARVNKESFNPGDTGVIYITNNTGMDLMTEIQPSQSYVQFQAKGHYIGESAEIPFQIRLSAFQAMTVKRQPALVSIEIKVRVRDELVFRRLKIRIGEFL